MMGLAPAMQKMQVRLDLLERSAQPAVDDRPDFEAFYDAIDKAANDNAAQPVNL